METNTGIIRRIDRLGRLVVPADYRDALDMREADEVEFILDKKAEQIIIRRPKPCCIDCRGTTNLIPIAAGFLICPACLEKLNKRR